MNLVRHVRLSTCSSRIRKPRNPLRLHLVLKAKQNCRAFILVRTRTLHEARIDIYIRFLKILSIVHLVQNIKYTSVTFICKMMLCTD
jgi:hypothetical protein